MVNRTAETPDARDLQAQLQHLDALIRRIDGFDDPAVREFLGETIQAVLDLHGAGLARILARLEGAGAAGGRVLAECLRDESIAGLLLLHGLHPASLEERVRRALDDVRPLLRSHGGDVELVELTDAGAARLRLTGSCHGCPSSSATMRQTIEEALLAAAPDLSAVALDGEPGAPGLVAADDGRPLVSLTVLPSR
jgi:Fe-S cluster biogenesis protein NfuA